MRRTLRSIIIASLIILFCWPTSVSKVEQAGSNPEACFAAHANRERDTRGIPKLSWDPTLASRSEAHTHRMANDGTIYHSIPPKGYAAWGENVGMGPSCDSIHAAFMASSGHKANILDRDYRLLGVGAEWRSGTLFVTEQFARKAQPKPRPKPPPKPPPDRCGS